MRFSRNWIGQYTELPDDRELTEALSALGLVVDAADPRGADLSLDLDVASNRPDVMNHVGVARELALARDSELRLPECASAGDGPATKEVFSLEIEAPDACPRFLACAVIDVDVVPSPAWLVERLESIGLRPINAVVDITNFVMWELGRPMHAYDLDKLTDARIVVRRAATGEALRTLDEIDRRLDPEDLVIADGSGPIGLAGLMGGEGTGVTETTRRVLLECAAFDPPTIRAMARRHGMHTDASHRFERGLPTVGVTAATARAASLIAELCGGRVASATVDSRAGAHEPTRLELPDERLTGLLGVEIETDRVLAILRGLGFDAEHGDDRFRLTVPAARLDITRDVDVIEEVARFYGYENLPDTLPLLRRSRREGAEHVLRREERLRDLCTGLGYWQAMTLVFSSEELERHFLGEETRLVSLANPLNEAMARLRARLLPGLLAVVARNLNVGADRVRIFEIGRTFREPEGDGAPIERRQLALLGAGLAQARHAVVAERAFGFADLKSAFEAVAARMRWPTVTWSPATAPGFQHGSTALVRCGDSEGVAGKLDPEVAEHFGIERDVWALEIDIEEPVRSVPAAVRAAQPARYPAAERDVTLLTPTDLPYERLERVVRGVEDVPLESLDLVDVYRGDDVPDDALALTLRLTFRSSERTLTAEEIESALGAILRGLEEQLQVVRR